MEQNTKTSKKILIIAAHPDDEVLGCGATASKHVDRGDDVYCVILGEGITSRTNKTTTDCRIDNISELHNQTLQAAEIIGIKEVFFSNFKDNRFDSLNLLDIIKEVEKHLTKINPDIIYTHHEFDLNIDHRRTFQAVITACRPCNPNSPSQIFSFEILSSTEWQSKDKKNAFFPNSYIDVSKQLERKISAMKAYKSEIKKYPHSRSPEGIEILTKYRGIECGLKSAEAFMLIRNIK
jgi:LmbE family N-acetylglucosaminyl deacetylase